MKKSIVIVLVAAMALAATTAGAVSLRSAKTASPAGTIKVMSFNIHHGEGDDAKIDLERIAAVINAEQPDIVALQEVDNKTSRSNGVDQAAYLAKATVMNYSYGKAFDYKGGSYGQALLYRGKLDQFDVVELPWLMVNGKKPEVRVALIAKLAAYNGAPALTFIGTHLAVGAVQGQNEQAQFLIDKYGSVSPLLIAGDFNASPDFKTMNIFRSKWTDATDKVSDTCHGKKIDYIMCSASGWQTVDAYSIDTNGASDHKALVAVLKYSAAARNNRAGSRLSLTR